MLAGSEVLASSEGIRTQDALSIRSIPQVHGATRDQLAHATRQVEIELNSVTDNPLLLGTPEAFRVVSQANPHGQSVAMAADLLCMAMAELGSIAERRLDRLINPMVSGLPAFLVTQPGVNSGMMIVQYVAASLCAENRQMAQPAVVDNYVTSGLQEDHLSLGTSAALKLHKVLGNTTQILAISICSRPRHSNFSRHRVLAWAPVPRGDCCASASRPMTKTAGWLGHRQQRGLIKDEASLERVFQHCRNNAAGL